LAFPLVIRNLNARDGILPLALFATALSVYVLTLCPSVYVGDSGEFITNALTLGINHPTGYPLYTVLSRLSVITFPFWHTAYAVNMLSALLAAASAVWLYYVLLLFTSRRSIAMGVAMMFAFSYTLWSRSTTAEVYTLNLFFVSLTFFLAVRWYFHQRSSDLLAVAYLTGLGLTQHVTGALCAVGILLLIVLRKPSTLVNFKLVGSMALLFLIGISTYLYLPVRSFADPPVDWGNPETLARLMGHFFPRSASALFGATKGEPISERLEWILSQALAKEFWYFGVLSLAGAFVLRKHWRVLVFTLSLVGLVLYFTIVRKLPLHADFDAYFIPVYFVLAFWIGVALEAATDVLEQRKRWAANAVSRYGVVAVAVLLPVTLLGVHFRENDRSSNVFAGDFGRNLLSSVKPNAILFTVGDEQLFLSWYFKYVDKLRPDITIVDRNLLGAVWGASHMYNRELGLPINERQPPILLARQIIEAYIGKRPIQFTHRVPWGFINEEYETYHNGMTIEILPKNTPLPPYIPTSFTFTHDWETTFFDRRCLLVVSFYPKELVDNAKFWFNHNNKDAAWNELELFFAFDPRFQPTEDLAVAFAMRSRILAERRQYEEAIAAADSSLRYAPNDWRVIEQRGNAYFMLGDSATAVTEWKRSLTLNPSNERLQRNVQILENKARLDSLRAITRLPYLPLQGQQRRNR
jgi:tetratricopeptide (TPR) repeat protein